LILTKNVKPIVRILPKTFGEGKAFRNGEGITKSGWNVSTRKDGRKRAWRDN